MATAEVVELAQRYGDEIQAKYEHIRQKAQGLQGEGQGKLQEWQAKAQDLANQAQPQIQNMAQEVQDAAQDMSNLESSEHRFLLETYFWLAVCLIFMGFGTVFGAIFAPIIEIFISSKPLCFLISVFLLPTYLYLYQRKVQMSPEESHWFSVLTGIILGIMLGYNFAGRNTMFYLPPHIFIAVGVTVAAGVVKAPSRQTFLGAALGTAFGLYLVYGMMMGLYGGYLFWMLIILAAHAVDIQIKIAHHRKGRALQGAEQAATLVLCYMLYTFCYFLSSYSNEDLAEMQKQEQNNKR